MAPGAKQPLVIETPVFVTHMSFGALSREAKVALESSYRYIFEYVPNRYSVTDGYLSRVDAVEIKIGQSAKPGMGGHLPGSKVTKEIAEIRGFPEGRDIISPAHHPDITNGA